MKYERYTKIIIKGDPNKEIYEIFRILHEYGKAEYRIRTLDKKPIFQNSSNFASSGQFKNTLPRLKNICGSFYSFYKAILKSSKAFSNLLKW